MASSFAREELKSSYKINGVGLLRLSTSNGAVDFEFNINEDVNDDIPF
jgi:hypothetical protein